MLDYNEVKTGKIIIYEGEPCEIMDYHVARTQQRKPQNQVKMRSLISGKAFNATFHVSDQAEEAEIISRDVKFLYTNKPARTNIQSGGGEYWFCDPENPANRFKIDEKIIGNAGKFLKTNMLATSIIFDDDGDEKIIKIKVPIKMEFKIKEAPPAVRGDTAKGGNKQAILENGTTILVPLFVSEGDTIRINTETGEYVERI